MTERSKHRVIYREGDPDMPEELSGLLVHILTKHLENSTNPYYTDFLKLLWDRSLTLAPDETIKIQHAKLCQQEVEHAVINANILKGFGVDKVDAPIEQYIFHLPLDSWVELNFMHALADRCGMYIGEVWEDVPYEPLRKVAPKLHKEEIFHANLGMSNLRQVCRTPEGVAEVEEGLKVWWPAALDMFGWSKSKMSAAYVKWGIRSKGNEELRRQYIGDTRPLFEEMGVTLPDDRANRQFL